MRSIGTPLIPTALLLSACTTLQPAAASPQSYELDNQHTHIVWQVDRFGFTKTIGTFVDVEGTLMVDEADIENSSVEAEIALSGLRSDLAEREDIIRGPHWLDAAKFPTVSFVSTAVELVRDPQCVTQCVTVNGMMTLKGISAPLVLHVQLNKAGTDPVAQKMAAGFSAHGAFLRQDFGVTIADGFVGDEVTFQIEALAVTSP